MRIIVPKNWKVILCTATFCNYILWWALKSVFSTSGSKSGFYCPGWGKKSIFWTPSRKKVMCDTGKDLFSGWPLDRKIREITGNFLKFWIKNYFNLFQICYIKWFTYSLNLNQSNFYWLNQWFTFSLIHQLKNICYC